MTDIEARIEHAKKEVSSNESLLDMLEIDSATEMFNWGVALAASIARTTEGMEDAAAEAALAPRLKSLRLALRSMGNWAVGKYSDPAERSQWKEKLTEHFQQIFGESASVSAAAISDLIDSVETAGTSPKELILKMKALLEKAG